MQVIFYASLIPKGSINYEKSCVCLSPRSRFEMVTGFHKEKKTNFAIGNEQATDGRLSLKPNVAI